MVKLEKQPMEKQPLYLLSGLGADERMFQNLIFEHPNPRFIQWIPARTKESLAAYAQRLVAQIEPTVQPPILVGVSFGGIMAQEIAKLIPVKKVIALSSLVSSADLPWYYRTAGKLRLQQWLPFRLMRQWQAPANWVFGAQTPEEKKLLKAVIRDTDIQYLRWALQQILNWHQPIPSPSTVIIHGDEDKVLPLPKYPQTKIVRGGEHLMLLSRAREVCTLINREL